MNFSKRPSKEHYCESVSLENYRVRYPVRNQNHDKQEKPTPGVKVGKKTCFVGTFR